MYIHAHFIYHFLMLRFKILSAVEEGALQEAASPILDLISLAGCVPLLRVPTKEDVVQGVARFLLVDSITRPLNQYVNYIYI